MCLNSLDTSAQKLEERTLLLDFNQLYDTIDIDVPFNERVVFTHNEVKAEAKTANGVKQVTILNLYVPQTFCDNSQGIHHIGNELKMFYLFPKIGYDSVYWQPVMATDSIVKTALNRADFLSSFGIKSGIRVEKYSITGIILKKENKYYYFDNKSSISGGCYPFDGHVTYYPTESESYNCKARVFTKQQIADEMQKIRKFIFANNGFDNDKRGLSKLFYLAHRDSITQICHFEQYYDLNDYNTEYYNKLCNMDGYPADFRCSPFTQIDVHSTMGTLGFFLLCDRADLLKKESDRLGNLYYHFKSIGGYDSVDKYINALNRNLKTKKYKL